MSLLIVILYRSPRWVDGRVTARLWALKHNMFDDSPQSVGCTYLWFYLSADGAVGPCAECVMYTYAAEGVFALRKYWFVKRIFANGANDFFQHGAHNVQMIRHLKENGVFALEVGGGHV